MLYEFAQSAKFLNGAIESRELRVEPFSKGCSLRRRGDVVVT